MLLQVKPDWAGTIRKQERRSRLKKQKNSRHPDAVYSRKYRNAHRKQKQCIHCPVEREPGKTMCQFHVDYYRAQAVQRRAAYANEPKEFVVYGLRDPQILDLGAAADVYVGHAQNVVARIASHFAEAASRNTKLAAWLLELKALGLKPVVVIHQQCYHRAGALKAEGTWIRIMRNLGAPLFNKHVPTGKHREIGNAKYRMDDPTKPTPDPTPKAAARTIMRMEVGKMMAMRRLCLHCGKDVNELPQPSEAAQRLALWEVRHETKETGRRN
jgi:hypothetical protein